MNPEQAQYVIFTETFRERPIGVCCLYASNACV